MRVIKMNRMGISALEFFGRLLHALLVPGNCCFHVAAWNNLRSFFALIPSGFLYASALHQLVSLDGEVEERRVVLFCPAAATMPTNQRVRSHLHSSLAIFLVAVLPKFAEGATIVEDRRTTECKLTCAVPLTLDFQCGSNGVSYINLEQLDCARKRCFPGKCLIIGQKERFPCGEH